ncbi:MAG: insulinase family protein [Candidatus Eisenbacteria sp.]|nr:insulinase family protein [Candidatus Eisenbacteria bacterium]
MMRGNHVIGMAALAAAVLMAVPCAQAQNLEGRVVEHTLDNGMKLILMRRSAAPVVSAVIRYNVGSVDETKGKTGLAHLYEHLAFRGTRIIGTRDYDLERQIRSRIDSLRTARRDLIHLQEEGAGTKTGTVDEMLSRLEADLEAVVIREELDQIYNINGAVGLNASTTADLTTFVVGLPANRLPLWAVLESDRMAHSVPRDFEVERDVVAREKQSRIEDDPEARLYRTYIETAFSVHPYRRPVPGYEGDLKSIRPKEAKAFYHTYYSPGNAVAAIVGDIDIQGVIALAETTFGRVPPRSLPERSIPAEPPQGEKRTVVLEHDSEPALFLGFHKGSICGADDPVFEVLIEILTGGNNARFHRSLFLDKRMAMDFSSWIGPGDRYPNLFTIAARPIWPHTGEEVEEAIWAELECLTREPVTDKELTRAKNRLAADFLRQLRDNRGMAKALTYYQCVTGDWRYLESRLALIEAIGLAEVQHCAARHFVRQNCTVAILRSTREKEHE